MEFDTNTVFELGKSYIVKLGDPISLDYEVDLYADHFPEDYVETNIMNKKEYKITFYDIEEHNYEIENIGELLHTNYSYWGTNELNCEFEMTRNKYKKGQFILFYPYHRDIVVSIVEDFEKQDAAMLKYKNSMDT